MTTGLLQFRVLGPLEAWRDDKPVRLGGERQRALLALLLVHANELVRTDQLVEQLFGDAASKGATNAVHAAVSRLRRVLEDGERDAVIVTRPGGYLVKAGPDQVDAARFERLLADGQRLLARDDAADAAECLREALALWRGPVLADLALVEFLQPEARRLEELRLVAVMGRIDAELQLGRHAVLIAELEALVAANPFQERLRAQLMLALYRAGRQADALDVYRQASEVLRDHLGLDPSPALQNLERLVLQQDASLEPTPAGGRAPPTRGPSSTTPLRERGSETAPVLPETRYTAGSEGLIAYQVVGDSPIDLVIMTGSTGHVDLRWESPEMSNFYARLASFSRLILFDRRGNGASDPVHRDVVPTWEDWAEDLGVVLDATGSESAAVLAVLDAGPMAMLFAATYPDRITALILANTTARWVAVDDYPQGLTRENAEAFIELIENEWGTEDFAALSNPSIADTSGRRWFAKYHRACASPRMAAAQLRPLLELDVRDVLPTIQVPTLVIHRRGFAFIDVDHARYLAEHIPQATLLELDGSDGGLAYGDADAVVDPVEEFLTGARQPAAADRWLATVLFSDLVDSTRLAADVGDREWRRLLDRHDELVQREVERFQGRVCKTLGDGVLATFDAPGRAIRCAQSIRYALAELGLEVRAGIHAGEVESRGDDVGGLAVHIAARVASLARGREILVSRTVADLIAGSGTMLTPHGTRTLKGVPGKWKLYLVERYRDPNGPS